MTTINDLSPKPKAVSISGNAVIASGQGKFGLASLFCPDNGSFLFLNDNQDFNLSNADYTIECWIKPSGDYSVNNTIITKRSQASGCSWSLYLSSGNGRLGFYNGVSYTGSAVPSSGIWNHVAAVVYTGNLQLYLNGTGILSSNITNQNINAPIYIGSYPPLNEQYKGYIDDLRITKGVSGARYLNNFNPPVGPFASTGNPITGPSAPLSFNNTGFGDSSLSLSWDVPIDDNGDDISSYTVEYTPSNGAPSFIDTNSTSLSYNLTGLTNGTTYSLRVAGLNIAGTGSYSSVVSGTPGTTPSQPLDLVASTGNTQLDLSWNVPSTNGGRNITDYAVQYSTGNNYTTLNTNSSNTSYNLTGLTNGLNYNVRVAAINILGTGTYSSIVSGIPSTVPSEPTGLLLTSASSDLNLTWFAPQNNGGQSVLDYVLQYSNNSGVSWTTYNDGISTALSSTITGLALDISYITRVAAVNVMGTGSYSLSSNSVYLTAGPPCDLVASGLPNPTCDLVASGLPDLMSYVYERDKIYSWH